MQNPIMGGVAALCVLLAACSPISSQSGLLQPSENKILSEAKMASDKGDFNQAAILYGQLYTSHTLPDDTVLSYADTLRLSGDFNKAEAVYQHLIDQSKLAPIVQEAQIGQALLWVKQGNFIKAQTVLEGLFKNNTMPLQQWRILNALGVVYTLQGYPTEATQAFRMAMGQSSNNPVVLNNVGLSIVLSGDYEEGIQILQYALDMKMPKKNLQRRLRHNLALAYGLNNQIQEAEELLKNDLTTAQIYNNLGVYAALRHDEMLAKSYLSQALTSSTAHYQKAEENLSMVQSPAQSIQQSATQQRIPLPVLRTN